MNVYRSQYIGRPLGELEVMQKQLITDACKRLAFLIVYGGLTVVMPNPISGGFFLGETVNIASKTINLYDMVLNRRFYLENSKEYIAMQYSYRLVLEELLKLFEKMGWDNEMQLFSGYSYMLRNGFFSREHKFYYSDDADWCLDFLGSNVMLGEGNCKHINGMLTDLLGIKGKQVCNLAMFIKGNEKFSFLCEDLILELESEEAQEKLYGSETANEKQLQWARKNGNHLVTGYTDDEHSYIMDAMNNVFFQVDKNLNVSHCGQQFDIFYRSFLNHGVPMKLSDFLKPSSPDLLDGRLIDYYSVLDMCPECTDIFEGFYQEHRELYDEVVVRRKVLMKEREKYFSSSL